MTIDQIINIEGPFLNYPLDIDFTTIQDSSDISRDRTRNQELFSYNLLTGEIALYLVKDNIPMLYLAKSDINPIFLKIQSEKDNIFKAEHLAFDQNDIISVINSESALAVELPYLELNERYPIEAGKIKEYDFTSAYFQIETAGYDSIQNPLQKSIIKWIYGADTTLDKYMTDLNNKNIKDIRFYLLHPEYVRHECQNNSKIGLARACGLRNIGLHTDFRADDDLFKMYGDIAPFKPDYYSPREKVFLRAAAKGPLPAKPQPVYIRPIIDEMTHLSAELQRLNLN